MQEDLRSVRGTAAVGAAAVGARRQVRRPHRHQEMQDKEVREGEGQVQEAVQKVQEAVQEEEVEEEV
eukprot:scaffold2739_cov47-Phaeocystis_antarctica.AAC.1